MTGDDWQYTEEAAKPGLCLNADHAALVDRLEAAEREEARWKEAWTRAAQGLADQVRRAETAEARVEAAERAYTNADRLLVAAESRVVRLEEALRAARSYVMPAASSGLDYRYKPAHRVLTQIDKALDSSVLLHPEEEGKP